MTRGKVTVFGLLSLDRLGTSMKDRQVTQRALQILLTGAQLHLRVGATSAMASSSHRAISAEPSCVLSI